jgi:molybdate transport system substrate-binding protein
VSRPRSARGLRWPLVLVLVAAGACGTADLDAPTGAPDLDGPTDAPTDRADDIDTADGTELAGELIVATPASLTDVFERLGDAFVHEHPDVEVVLNIASSSSLAAQLLAGAPGDVFASADSGQMQRVVDAGLARDPEVLATNELAIAVEPGNPPGVTGLRDLARDDLVLVLAGEEVPAGRYAAQVLAAADVEVAPASLELDVRAVLGKVAAGEADAGLVYRSDVVAGGDRVEGIPIPAADNVVAKYPVAVLAEARDPSLADAFVGFVQGPDGDRALLDAGFTPR